MSSFLIILGIVVLLFQIKIFRIYLAPLNTLIHEISHGVMALLLGGKLTKIKLYASGEGEATTLSRNKFFQLFISYAGYTGSHLFVLFFFYQLYVVENLEFLTYSLLVILAASWLLWIRSWFGFIWTIVFFAMTLAAHLYIPVDYQLFFLNFIGSILLYQAFITPFHLIGLAKKDKREAGDASSLNKITKIPTMFWALLFSGQSFVMLYLLLDYILL